jgi:UDP-N-acetylglucosamine 1-carboxyvinyltransferase
MLEKFTIRGKRKLSGIIDVRGSKNAAFPILAASLLTDKTCQISNLPLIKDVMKMLEILERIGAKITWLGEREININCSDIDPSFLPKELIGHLRGSIVLLGPLLARFGKLKFPLPGGDQIGARPIDTHLDAFSQMGVKVNSNNKSLHFEGKIKNGEVILREFSVTATSNIISAAALIPGKTVIKVASYDYEIQELIKVLSQMGVKIINFSDNSFIIEGKKRLNGFKAQLVSDPLETGTFLTMALATRSKIMIKKASIQFLTLFLKRLKDFGAKFEIKNSEEILVLPSPILKMDKIQSLPYPGIATDLQPELGVLATQSKGPTLIHDPLYEGRLKYLDELNKMGASIIFCDPHRAIINGPTQLYGKEIPSLDIRSGAAFITAGLVASGKTIINDTYPIDRGYEKIEERLQKLGADVQRISA